MKILITTGIYPPKIGGPAQYSKNLKEEFEKMGHTVAVKTYGREEFFPTGLRHAFYFLKIIPQIMKSEAVFVMDTFSVGLPAVLASKIFGKKPIIRTGGDMLWEQYVERTKKKVLFRDFYKTEKNGFSLKERALFYMTGWTLRNASKIVFSTEWQREIFIEAYGLNKNETAVVENYYGPKEVPSDPSDKTFIASARKLVWKNFDVLEKVFDKVRESRPDVKLFTDNLPYEEFLGKMKSSYAVVLVSLGDISPNLILDAIRLRKPFICTREVGIFERIKDAGIFIDPMDEKTIEAEIANLLTEGGYKQAKEKVEKFDFLHTWGEIAKEFLEIHNMFSSPKLGFFGILKNVFNSFIFLRYFICGITSAALNIFSLYVFTDIVGIWYLYSSVIAFLISLVVSFNLQKFVVFKDMKTYAMRSQFLKFSMVIVLGVMTNTVLVFVSVDILGVWYILSQLIAGFFVMIQNFILYRYFIFKK